MLISILKTCTSKRIKEIEGKKKKNEEKEEDKRKRKKENENSWKAVSV